MALFLLGALFLNTDFLQAQSRSHGLVLNPSIGIQYHRRSIQFDEDSFKYSLKSFLLTIHSEFEIQAGLSVTAILGYSLTNYDDITFRRLPVSVQLDAEQIQSYIVGISVDKNIIRFNDFAISGIAQGIYNLGVRKEWNIPGLAVEGTVSGMPLWTNLKIGPKHKYTGFGSFFPYFFLGYDHLKGNFSMEETGEKDA